MPFPNWALDPSVLDIAGMLEDNHVYTLPTSLKRKSAKEILSM